MNWSETCPVCKRRHKKFPKSCYLRQKNMPRVRSAWLSYIVRQQMNKGYKT